MLDRKALPLKIDVILEFLSSDDGPHSTKEISTVLTIPLDECERIMGFLIYYDFVKSEENGLKIDHKTRELVLATSDKPILAHARYS